MFLLDFLGASVTMLIQAGFAGATYMYSVYYPNPIVTIGVYCKIWFYTNQSVSMMFRWMLTAACLDRYALSSTNARLRHYANIKNTRLTVIIIVIVWIILPIPLLVLDGVRAGTCNVIYGYAASLYNNIFTMINGYVIPIITMTICSLLIQKNLANKRERRHINIHQPQGENNKQYLERRRDQQALVMLFAQIFVYFILTTPWMIYNIYSTLALDIINKSANRMAIERLAYSLSSLTVLLFPTSSFYLYTLASSMYRKELLIMLRSALPCRYFNNNRRIEPIRHTLTQRAVTLQ
ncbi:unnamed protein product [Adineta steineri]|uniref:G-protein coupled receptors family 1 profile domain-containing protein n=1 Tax=Adineta steineri TaxID=433720 RepID=A0A813SVN7_9BILA|nr:unnamed protein product [Adineta steineri]CAF4115381.1 unnamed protein product [Adineta steineri]